MEYEKLKIHNLLAIPIKIQNKKSNDNNLDYECICKYCTNPSKYLTEYDGCSYL